MHSSSGSGHDDSVSTSSAPYFYSFGEPVGNRTTTSTRDHIASEETKVSGVIDDENYMLNKDS